MKKKKLQNKNGKTDLPVYEVVFDEYTKITGINITFPDIELPPECDTDKFIELYRKRVSDECDKVTAWMEANFWLTDTELANWKEKNNQ